jgi:hypothetical protein
MENSIPHLRLARKDSGRRGRVGGNIGARTPSAQEMKNGSDKNNTEK